MIGQAGQWTRTPSATPLQPKKWNAHFWITFTLDDWPGWSMDSNPIHHPSPANKMKCFFLDYVHYWWSARLVNGLKPHLPPLSSQKKWNAHFWIMFNFWWLAGLVDGLEPHPPPLSTQKNEMLIFGLCSTSDDWLSCSIDLNPIHHPSPPKNMKCLSLYNIQHLMLTRLVNGLKPHLPPSLAKKWNVHFWIMFNFWWLAGLVDGLKPHPPPLSSQKREMLIFGLHSTSDNQLGWSMDSNPIHHPSPANKMKCSFLDYVELLIIGQAGWWTQTPSATPLQLIKWNAHFWNTFNFWWSAWLVNGLEPHLPALSSQKNEMLLFGLRSTSDDRLGWLMDSNPICQPSPAKKMKCYFLDYVQLLMIGWASQWTQTPSSTSLQPIKWNVWFWITLNFWWLTRLVDGLKPHQPSLSSLKHEMLVFVLHSTSDVGQAAQWTQTPSATLSSQKNEILIFGLCSTSDDQPGWSMDLNPICHPSPPKKVKWSFLD